MDEGSYPEPGCTPTPCDQSGLVLLAVLLALVTMTLLGLLALTVNDLGNRLAVLATSGESAVSAAEACVGTSVKIIQDTIMEAVVPSTYLDTASPPGPVPSTNAAILLAEIFGNSDNNPDTAATVPNTFMTVNNFSVRGDIDRLYLAHRPGSACEFGDSYASTNCTDIFYRIDCTATDPVTGASSRITAVYVCSVTGESCQKKT